MINGDTIEYGIVKVYNRLFYYIGDTIEYGIVNSIILFVRLLGCSHFFA
jgi:hypothetical protein